MCKYKIENILLKQQIQELNNEIKKLLKQKIELLKINNTYNEESLCDSDCCNMTICNFD
jgi:hypothetical protein